MKDYQYLQRRYLVNTYPNRGLTIISSQGIYLYDLNGEKYLDLMSNYGVNIFGYNHAFLLEKIIDQLKKLPTLHCSFNNDMRAQAAEKLVKRCGYGLTQLYFSNSGAEAVEAALKFAVLATGRHKFIACRHGYHGKTLGALSATYEKKYKDRFEPLLWQFKHVNFDDLTELEKAIDNQTAAFIVEPIQGESGIIVPKDDYLTKVRKICDEKNILLIIDEIQTGIGRTGCFLASHTNHIQYDIVCLGKGLAGGIPVGATLVSGNIANKIPRFSHTSTFGGNPLACAGIMAVLELLNNKMLEDIKKTGAYFINSLKTIKSSLIKDIRGCGLMIGVEISGNRNGVLKKLQQERILAIPAGENVIRFLPPYIIKQEHIDFVVKTIEKILLFQ